MTTLEFTIPWPPTVNHYWLRSRTGSLFLSQRARNFRVSVFDAVSKALVVHGVPISQAFRDCDNLVLILELHPPDRRKRDIDNVLKATLDALEHARLVKNDNLFKTLLVTWGEPVCGGNCRITLSQRIVITISD